MYPPKQNNLNDLIENSYKNNFGIDLKRIHRSKKSQYGNEKKLIKEINDNNRIVFDDGISKKFELINFNGLNYLVGDKTAYPCSDIIRIGNGLNWIMCYALPNNNKISGETDIRKSGIILHYFSEVVTKFNTEEDFRRFLQAVEFSFSENYWYNKNNFILNQYRNVKFWSKKEKIDQIFAEGLVSPRKYLTYVLFKNENLKTEKIIHSLLRSLSYGTKAVISNEEFISFLGQLNLEEIEEFFCLDYLRIHSKIDKISYTLLGDMLVINSGHTRKYADWDRKIYSSNEIKNIFYSRLKNNYRSLENHIRQEKGFDEVGSYVMERHLLNLLAIEFPLYTIISQYSPKWLNGQRFDIFIKELNIAIEYNGIQHFEPIDFFGGIEGLAQTQFLDHQKREKSLKNGVKVFDINYNQNFNDSFSKLVFSLKELLQS
ncbi:hypothetical protein PGH12_07835 [Chryseobacterium wangxinyae]|uniref:hypothetical protein n=1 Tax=Chryseobacterium sp. CY350 TaxID=2997336 RepID=UPI0022711C00|nr:hypothetical protein [Chryseobacterium sp. CY350]MCY0977055.1 hypothetical protein [Chryseobacterium sp. CY350]WBZ97053.1 hypothetical protein PGH12_07835 [Chryseobacterium sp. CY350]